MGKNRVKNLYRDCATLCVAFLLTCVCSGILTSVKVTSALECADGVTLSGGICGTDIADVHVSVEGGWAISVSSAGTLGVDVSPTNSGVLSTVVDNVNVYTNIPTGYQLYLNSTSGSTDIYNNGLLDDNGNLSANLPSGTNTNHFTATTGTKDVPIALTNNTWGYSLDNSSTTFSKVPLTSEDPDSNIHTANTKTPSEGDDIPVTYGFKADTSLSPGTYSTSVTYTAIADVPTYTITSVSPNELRINDQTDKTITFMTSTPVTELAFGNISAKIGTVDLTNCTEITSDGYRGVECTYNGNLDYGTYNVELTSSWHNATYVLEGGFKIGGKTIADITYMQEMTSDICEATPLGQTATLQDTRGSYNTTTPANYGVIKAKDGNCWMTSNLNLYDRTVTSENSDFPSGNYTIPASVNRSNWNTNVTTAPRVHRATNSGYTDQVYFNWCTAVALTSCTTTEAQDRSICPKGWMLPVDGDKNVNKTYTRLLDEYGITTGEQLISNDVLGVTKYYGMFAHSYFGGEYNQGSQGTFWTAIPTSATQSFTYKYSKTSVQRIGYDEKGYGYSIRCVAR